MQVFQTEGDPPNMGRIILANIGSIQKSRKELRNKDRANIKSIREVLIYNSFIFCSSISPLRGFNLRLLPHNIDKNFLFSWCEDRGAGLACQEISCIRIASKKYFPPISLPFFRKDMSDRPRTFCLSILVWLFYFYRRSRVKL